MIIKLILFLIYINFTSAHLSLNLEHQTTVFDQKLYEEALNPEECQKQLNYLLRNNTLLFMQFLEAGPRISKGFLKGNTLDMGSYYECLGINERAVDMDIKGKYCVIRTNSESRTVNYPQWLRLNEFSKDDWKKTKQYELNELYGSQSGRSFPGDILSNISLRLALCIPKPCTTKEAIDGILFNLTSSGLDYQDEFCRLPDDKLWGPGDTIAVIILSFIGFLTILSTGYDIWCSRSIKDCQQVNPILLSFSVITNARSLFEISSKPGSLDCLDGIRAITMLWVLLGHSFSSQPFTINPLDTSKWVSSLSALWVVSGHVAVDTFFMLSGLLVVYSTVGKTTSWNLLKNLHKFYLNRLLRMFPLLALTILLEATLLNHILDGPFWNSVANNAQLCRTYWWSTLLYIQNYLNAENVCVGITWYLAIDVQLHILSPLVLFWVASGKRRVAWSALTLALLGSISAATAYNFLKNFPSGMMTPRRMHEMMYYMIYYYMNTLTRAPPFVVGMVYGYLLHLWRGKQIKISKISNAGLWLLALSLKGLILYTSYPIMQLDWDSQTADTLINSFLRPAWAMALGWVIFSCVQGYGGPVNWLLSLKFWKIPARLSYALYVMHYSIMVVINSTRVAPIYFTVSTIIFYFLGVLMVCLLIAILACITIDLPFSILFRILMSGQMKEQQRSKK